MPTTKKLIISPLVKNWEGLSVVFLNIKEHSFRDDAISHGMQVDGCLWTLWR